MSIFPSMNVRLQWVRCSEFYFVPSKQISIEVLDTLSPCIASKFQAKKHSLLEKFSLIKTSVDNVIIAFVIKMSYSVK